MRVRVRVRARETKSRGKGAHLRVEGERGDGVADVKHLVQRLGRGRREHAARVRVRMRVRVRVGIRVGIRVGVGVEGYLRLP